MADLREEFNDNELGLDIDPSWISENKPDPQGELEKLLPNAEDRKRVDEVFKWIETSDEGHKAMLTADGGRSLMQQKLKEAGLDLDDKKAGEIFKHVTDREWDKVQKKMSLREDPEFIKFAESLGRNGYKDDVNKLAERCTINKYGAITGLDLSGLELKGSLDLNIPLMSHVEDLDVTGNNLDKINVSPRSGVAKNVTRFNAGDQDVLPYKTDKIIPVDFPGEDYIPDRDIVTKEKVEEAVYKQEERIREYNKEPAEYLEELYSRLKRDNNYKGNIEDLAERCRVDRQGIKEFDAHGMNLSGKLNLLQIAPWIEKLDITGNPKITGVSIDERSPLNERKKIAEAGGPDYGDCYKNDKVTFLTACDENNQFYTDESLDKLDQSVNEAEKKIEEIGKKVDSEKPSEYNALRKSCEDVMRQKNNLYGELRELKATLKTMDDSLQALKLKNISISENAKDYYRTELDSATIGKELSEIMESRIKETEIGIFGQGLKSIQKMADSMNHDGFIEELTKQIKEELRQNNKPINEENLRKAAQEKASDLWNIRAANVKTADIAVAYNKDIAFNARNYGRDGLRNVRAAKNAYLKAERELRKHIRRSPKLEKHINDKIAKLEQEKIKLEKRLERVNRRRVRRGRIRTYWRAITGQSMYNLRLARENFNSEQFKLHREYDKDNKLIQKMDMVDADIKKQKMDISANKGITKKLSDNVEEEKIASKETNEMTHVNYVAEKVGFNLRATMDKYERIYNEAKYQLTEGIKKNIESNNKEIEKLRTQKKDLIKEYSGKQKKFETLDDKLKRANSRLEELRQGAPEKKPEPKRDKSQKPKNEKFKR